MISSIRIQWSEQEPIIEVVDTEELERALDHIERHLNTEQPTIVFVEAHGYRIALGLGCKESFVQLESESGEPPYLVTIGDASATGVAAFYLFENHYTEIPRCNLIPATKAREVLIETIQTAIRPTCVEWKEI